jgi:hypothetical protein
MDSIMQTAAKRISFTVSAHQLHTVADRLDASSGPGGMRIAIRIAWKLLCETWEVTAGSVRLRLEEFSEGGSRHSRNRAEQAFE